MSSVNIHTSFFWPRCPSINVVCEQWRTIIWTLLFRWIFFRPIVSRYLVSFSRTLCVTSSYTSFYHCFLLKALMGCYIERKRYFSFQISYNYLQPSPNSQARESFYFQQNPFQSLKSCSQGEKVALPNSNAYASKYSHLLSSEPSSLTAEAKQSRNYGMGK